MLIWDTVLQTDILLSAHLEDGGFHELALHGVDITRKVGGERHTASQTVSGEQGRSQRHCAALADKLGSSKERENDQQPLHSTMDL